MNRMLLNGSIVEEFDHAIDITIHTKCPAKWKLIDLETGEEYIGNSNSTPFDILSGIKTGSIGQKASIHYGTWTKTKRRIK